MAHQASLVRRFYNLLSIDLLVFSVYPMKSIPTHFIGLLVYYIHQTKSVKLSVEGSISLGKDVVNTLSQFLGNTLLSGRRSLTPEIEDTIVEIVSTADLCRNLAFCQNIRKFFEDFLTVLAKSIKTVLQQMLNEKFNDIAYEQQLKHYIDITRNIVEHANSKVTEDKEVYYWIDTIKTVCARFQEMAMIIVTDVLQVNPQDVSKINSELNRKLIIATVLVEMKYQTKLCEEYNICTKSYEVTTSFNKLLEGLNTAQDDKVRLFIKYFYEALFDTTFYSYVNEKSAHELQVILNDMAYSSEVPTKNILLTVQEVVKARLEVLETNRDIKISHDALLMHVILSDMDHIYSVHKSDPFKQFFQHFYDWLVVDVKISRVIRHTMKDINSELKTVPDHMLVKIISELRVFLELTIDNENKNS